MSTGGQALSNFIARNTDGIDPGASRGVTRDGFIVGNRVSTRDDMVALKRNAEGGANNIVIAHNHFGTGHGMSLGSATIKGITNNHVSTSRSTATCLSTRTLDRATSSGCG